jgi:UDP-N-acetylmuramoyl-tripeptide--D-alanyl-D-alanine ligase
MQACLLSEVARRMNGRVVQGEETRRVQRLHTDSRSVRAGDCFVALSGERFDGHGFVAAVAEAGAVAAVVSHPPEKGLWPEGLGLIQVEDTLKGLQDFASAYRSVLDLRVIGVTGSSGKTTTKEMVASVLRQKFTTKATQGNLNNHIGVPLTLLDLEPGDECAVVEMGMNHAGEIAPLAQMARPEIGVITNIGTAHIENLGNQEAIAREKAALIQALPENGVAILNADDAMLPLLRSLTSVRVVMAGFAAEAHWRASNVEVTTEGTRFVLHHAEQKVPVLLPLFSKVLVSNAVLAAAVGGECGLSLAEIAQGLAETKVPGQRMRVVRLDGGWIIDDSYNANADSMRAALDALRDFPAAGRRIAVLGSMGELGSHAVELHRQVGEVVARLKIDFGIFLGPNAGDLADGARVAGLASTQICQGEGAAEALSWLKAQRQQGDCILVKGSRFMKLEEVVKGLVPHEEGGH